MRKVIADTERFIHPEDHDFLLMERGIWVYFILNLVK